MDSNILSFYHILIQNSCKKMLDSHILTKILCCQSHILSFITGKGWVQNDEKDKHSKRWVQSKCFNAYDYMSLLKSHMISSSKFSLWEKKSPCIDLKLFRTMSYVVRRTPLSYKSKQKSTKLVSWGDI